MNRLVERLRELLGARVQDLIVDRGEVTLVVDGADVVDIGETLRDTPDLEGNLLDNSCVLAVTECSWGYDHSIVDMPILVAGKASGYLRYPGVHYREVGGNTSDVLLTCLQAVGTELTSVGGEEGRSETPCTGILA